MATFNINENHAIHNYEAGDDELPIKEVTVGARLIPAEKEEIRRMARAEGLTESQWVRDGLSLRAIFRGDDFHKLVANAEDIKAMLADEPLPVILRR